MAQAMLGGEGMLTTARLSSAKVALTNMAPKTNPRLLSVSPMQRFQRGTQVCEGKWGCHLHQLRPLAAHLTRDGPVPSPSLGRSCCFGFRWRRKGGSMASRCPKDAGGCKALVVAGKAFRSRVAESQVGVVLQGW